MEAPSKDRRRYPRIPLALEVELKRKTWERHVADDVSRRGIYVRMAAPCPVAQLMQVRITLPGDTRPLDMMAKVARRMGLETALVDGRMPGIGLEFFCLSNDVIERWDRFVLAAADRMYDTPGVTSYELFRLLVREPIRLDGPAIKAAIAQTEANAASNSAGASGAKPMPSAAARKAQSNQSNLIYRAANAEKLEKFMKEELTNGLFPMKIPYRMEENVATTLRVIHPATQEEFLIPGRILAGAEKDAYNIHFDQKGPQVLKAFERFIATGRPEEAVGGLS